MEKEMVRTAVTLARGVETPEVMSAMRSRDDVVFNRGSM